MLEYNVYTDAWLTPQTDGETAGTVGQSQALQALNIESDDNLRYKVHVSNVGWMDWMPRGQDAGLIGQDQQLEAFAVELIDPPDGRHVWYRAHVQNVGWTDWTMDGAIAGSVGQALRLEAVEIQIVDENTNENFDDWYDNQLKCKIGDVVFTVTTDEDATMTLDITDKAVEGGSISDHAVLKPLAMSINGMIFGDDAQTKLEAIRKYMKDAAVLRYVGVDTAANVMIESFATKRAANIKNGVSFTMSLKEIRIATGIVTVIDDAYVATQLNDLKNGGLQAVVTI